MIPFIIIGTFLVVGILLFVFGLYYLQKKQMIENIPTSKIRSLAMGLVEIFGEALPLKENEIIIAPFSNKPCVYSRFTIEEYRSSGKSSSWVTIKRGEDRKPFYLKDETGKVLIDPNRANINIKMDAEYRSGLGKDPPESVKQFLNRTNIRFEGMIFGINKQMRYREHIIEPGDNLYIMGTAVDNPFIQEAKAVKGVKDIIIQKGRTEKLFIISDKSEKKLLKHLWFASIFLLAFGSIFIILSVSSLLSLVIL